MPEPRCDCGMPHLGGQEHADECPAGVHDPLGHLAKGPDLKAIPVKVRPWPGGSGKSREHQVGATGAANRVRVLTGPRPDSDSVLVSWRDGRHRTVAEAELMVAELMVACRIAREFGG